VSLLLTAVVKSHDQLELGFDPLVWHPLAILLLLAKFADLW